MYSSRYDELTAFPTAINRDASLSEKLVNSILNNDGLNEVSCVDKFINNEVISILCDRLSDDHSRKKLILRGNCIKLNGAQSLSMLLSKNKGINSISLEWNQLSDDGANSIAKGLSLNHTLTHLDLRNNGK
jgi:hypothetical protein